MAANSGMLVAANVDLDAAVGVRYRTQNVANTTRDQTKLIALLGSIAESQGGKKVRWATRPLSGPNGKCAADLAEAIWDFQTHWKLRGVFKQIDGVVDPKMNTLKHLNALANGAPIPSTRYLQYPVPMVAQGQNPICWVSCMAMVASERRKVTVGVGDYIHGFDPSLGSIPNPYDGGYSDYANRLNRCGFTSLNIDSAEELEETMRERGPLILTHFCAGFPYNVTNVPAFKPGDKHAVVLTGIDIDLGVGLTLTNNPWGNKNVPLSIPSALAASQKIRAYGPGFAYYRASARAP
jgi:hypothetical protein